MEKLLRSNNTLLINHLPRILSIIQILNMMMYLTMSVSPSKTWTCSSHKRSEANDRDAGNEASINCCSYVSGACLASRNPDVISLLLQHQHRQLHFKSHGEHYTSSYTHFAHTGIPSLNFHLKKRGEQGEDGRHVLIPVAAEAGAASSTKGCR